jgi:hypothetical protein
VIKGRQVFRHPFISILASHDVDQRVIDSHFGQQSEVSRRRHRQPFPETVRIAMLSLLP